jgi:hypothetical protein
MEAHMDRKAAILSLEPVQNLFVIRNFWGAFLALRAKNRAFRSNSSDLPMQILRDFRFNPLRAQGVSRY